MTMREQMDAAWKERVVGRGAFTDREFFEAGFQAALDLFREPSDEMVERCAKAMKMDARVDSKGSFMPHAARACLAAAVGDE